MGRAYARHLRLSRRNARPRNIAVTKSLDPDRAIRVLEFEMPRNTCESNVRPAAKTPPQTLFSYVATAPIGVPPARPPACSDWHLPGRRPAALAP